MSRPFFSTCLWPLTGLAFWMILGVQRAVKTAEMNQQTFCLCKPRAVSLLSLFPLPLLSCFSATPASGNSNLSHISPWALEESGLERKWQVRRKLNHCAWVHLLHFVHVSCFCFPALAAFLQSSAGSPHPPNRKAKDTTIIKRFAGKSSTSLRPEMFFSCKAVHFFFFFFFIGLCLLVQKTWAVVWACWKPETAVNVSLSVAQLPFS